MPTAEPYKGINFLFMLLGLIKTIPRSLLANVDVNKASSFLLFANTLLLITHCTSFQKLLHKWRGMYKIYEKQRKFITAECYYAQGSETHSDTVNVRSRVNSRFTEQCCQVRFCRVGGAFLFSLVFGGKVGGFSIHETAKTFITNSSSFLG